MFIQFYIFWNSAILENNLPDLPSPRAPALQARKRFVLVLLRAFRSVTSRKSKACTEDLGLVCALKLRKDPGWGWSRDTPESGVFSISVLREDVHKNQT